LGCGGTTVDIKLHGDAIVWSRFGYQNDYDENLETESFQQYGPFRFDFDDYRAVLLSTIPRDPSH
jgi:hypothetical protein